MLRLPKKPAKLLAFLSAKIKMVKSFWPLAVSCDLSRVYMAVSDALTLFYTLDGQNGPKFWFRVLFFDH